MDRKRVSFNDAMRLFGSNRDDGETAPPAGGEETGRREPPSESVSQLATRIKDSLESLGGSIRVRGEISNFTDKNHWYFSLKDEQAVIGCAMWQEQARRVGWTPREGDAVVATGSVSFFAKQGRAQFYVRSIERVGVGSLQERYEAVCRELRGLGYFDDDRKLAIPTFPRRIAVVTSATGAAIHDCLRTAAHRCPAVGIVVVDVKVQGEGAANEVARAVRALDRAATHLGIDAIIVTRGGGAIEDLWSFNERVVAEAVFARRRVPIIAAIGHESDTTIIELVADRRASTPTQAVMLVVPDRAELGEQVEALGDRLRSALRRSVRERREILERVARHPFLRSPLLPLQQRRERLAVFGRQLERAVAVRIGRTRQSLLSAAAVLAARRPEVRLATERGTLRDRTARLEAAMRRMLERRGDRLRASQRQLEAVSPQQVLARGFSYTTRTDGGLVRSIHDAPAGTGLTTVVADGSIASTVVGKPAAARRRAADGSVDRSAGFDLFAPSE